MLKKTAYLLMFIALWPPAVLKAGDYPVLDRLIKAAKNKDAVAMAALYPPVAREMALFRGRGLPAKALRYYHTGLGRLLKIETVAKMKCVHEGAPIQTALVAALSPRRDMPRLPRRFWRILEKRGDLVVYQGHQMVRHVVILFKLSPQVRMVLFRGFGWKNPSLKDGAWLPYRVFFGLRGRQAWNRLLRLYKCYPTGGAPSAKKMGKKK